jgi:hypothetical protein
VKIEGREKPTMVHCVEAIVGARTGKVEMADFTSPAWSRVLRITEANKRASCCLAPDLKIWSSAV